jgi:trehalose 6-phosphate phosphatase
VERATEETQDAEALLAPLLERPGDSAICTDVDGTIAPIAERPEDAAVLPEAKKLLERFADRFGLVVCVSGRRALDARRLVGAEGAVYIGNHGFERLMPGDSEPQPDPALDGHDADVRAFAAMLDADELAQLGIRREDKESIQALHWRGSPDEAAAEARVHEIAADAEWRGLVAHWGRKVLEIRPPLRIGKGGAMAHLFEEKGLDSALYGGDDHTDVEAFATLRGLRERGKLKTAICVGIGSAEQPADLATAADLVVDGPESFVSLLSKLGN